MLDQKTHGHEVAVRQAVGHLGHVGRSALGFGAFRIGTGCIDGVDQVLDRHRRDELIGGKLGAVTFGVLIHHRGDGAVVLTQFDHRGVGQHLDAGVLTVGFHSLPQLAGAILRVPEFLDKRGLDLGVGALLGK